MSNSIAKKWLILSILLISMWNAKACDVCGCSVFNQNLGILPQFNSHFFGVRYSYRNFRSEHPSILFPRVSHERYQVGELFGRYVIGQRWQVLGFLPLNFHTKEEEGTKDNIRGFGDAYVMGLYSIINHKKSRSETIYQNFQIGGGIKLPTGKSDFETKEYGWIPGVQIGSGTIDFLSTATYILRHKTWGLVAETGLKITTKNKKYEHKFGNAFNQSLRFFTVFENSNWTFMPTIGMGFESWLADKKDGFLVDLTGGHITSVTMGLDFIFSKFNVGFGGHLPVNQNIGRGFINSQARLNGQLIYFF